MTYVNLSSNAQVTDAGLANFEGCKSLSQLYLGGTQITDAGLARLKECQGLTDLDLANTKGTAKGVEELKQALPQCNIKWGGSGTEPAKQ